MSDYLVAVGGVMIAPGIESQSKLTLLHGAAHDGNAEDLSVLLSSSPSLALEQDDNGWTALQIAVRSGNLDCVKLLVQKGADVNHRTNGGRGASALFLAERYCGKDHLISSVLLANGGLSRSPTFEF
jgi:ankyrin repeat protein